MVNFTVDEMREIMGRPNSVRNLSVIAHVDHGKSTLTDSLVQKAGIISAQAAGNARFTDTRQDEQDRCITIKSTGISMYFKRKTETGSEDFLINLIDSPGHVDFSSEVTAALRVTDGGLVVVDAVDGVCVQTETVLRQALEELVRPILHMNKLDRAIMELQQGPEDIYEKCRATVENVNIVVSTYQNESIMGDMQVSPGDGNVSFGSGLQGWAFTITDFSRIYSSKFGVPLEKLRKRLWGESFFVPKTKKWVDKPSEGSVRGFCQFIMEPICSMCKAVLNDNKEVYTSMLTKLNVTLTSEERNLTGKQLLKRIMQLWLPAGDCLLNMIVDHLPSPVKAQKYRYKYLYSGPLDDESALAISRCDPEGPLTMFISKMVPANDRRFYAFGRVLSGRVSTGQKVRIMGPNYKFGQKTDYFEKSIQRTAIMMGKYVEQVVDIPAGNTGCLIGIDQYLVKTGTLSTDPNGHKIRDMSYSVSPIVRVAVKPKDQRDLPKLIDGLKRLSKSDPLVQCFINEQTGEYVVCGCGELHVEICLKDLRDDFAQIEFIKSDPLVSYRETITAPSEVFMAKSPNKHNKFYMTAEPFPEGLAEDIDEGKFKLTSDTKQRATDLAEKYSIEKSMSLKTWFYGPQEVGPNMLVDSTSSVQNIPEIKDSARIAFNNATEQGVLAEEQMRGIVFRLTDAVLHADNIHRGAGQVVQPLQRVMWACQYRGAPRLMEPIFLVDISCPQRSVSGVYSCFNQRRGTVYEDLARPGTPMHYLKGHLPVAASFGFASALREATSGQAFPQCSFSHWSIMNGDPFEPNGKIRELCMQIRKTKDAKQEFPKFDDLHDRA